MTTSYFRKVRAFLSLISVLGVFLLAADYVSVTGQNDSMLIQTENQIRRESRLLGSVIRESILKHDYATVEAFLHQWGNDHEDVVSIEAVAPNGFVLAHYSSGRTSDDPLEIGHEVEFSGQELLSLKLTYDITPLRNSLRELLWRHIAFSLLFVIFLAFLVWFTLRRTALVPLETMLAEINRLNEGLEDRVRERTENLRTLNDELEGEIAERKRVEDELKASEEKFRTIFDQAMDGILLADAESRQFLSGNRMICKMLGYSPEEIRNLMVKDIHPEKDLPHVISQFELQLRGEIVRAESIPVKRKDGSVFYADISSAPLELRGRHYLMGIFRDMTERRKLEEQLMQSQKMEAIGQLAGGVAHDFNNILTAIIGYANLLEMNISKSDPLMMHLDQILSSAERAANLTQSLLAFSRKQIISFKAEDLNQIIKKMEKLLSRVISEDIEMRTNFDGQEIIVEADAGQIEQVLMNLVTNARDAMPHGGVLTIKTDVVLIDHEFVRVHNFGKPGRYALLSVSDSGAGMEKAIQDRIFEPFFTTKEFGKGTGLGLSTAYGIIQQHNGHISVYSEPGAGTTFKIYLPISGRQKQAEVPVPESQEIRGGTETVLVAEDDPSIRTLLLKVLERAGYTVFEAGDGDDAVRRFMDNSGTIELLILDVVMPKKSGNQVLEEIRKVFPNVKCLFLSGYAADLVRGKGIIGDAPIIMKPIAVRDLLGKVREVLDAA